ncbi:hypothetical protein JCM11251_001526 [Rhodosporidiobolus azoricus]
MSRQPFGMPKQLPHYDDTPESLSTDPFWLPSRTSRGGSGPKLRSQSPGLLGMIGLAQPSLEVTLAQDVFFLHPSPEGVPTDDELVTGQVRLRLPKARTLKHLTVWLVGRYDIGWPDQTPYESGKCLERTVSLVQGDEELQLEKGEHVFEFIIIVPANTACYERCQYGRVRHSITAKAKGLGITGGDLLSNEKPIFCIENPGLQDASKPPPPLHIKNEGSLEEIGPYSMALQSQHIMVGGLLLFRLSLLFPPIDLFVYSIKVKILQQFTLRSPLGDHHTCTPPPSAQTVFILDCTHPPNNAKVQDEGRGARSGSQTPRVGPLKCLQKDEMWNVIHLARLPNDNHIRPTTPEGTESPITVHHTLQCEITYRPMTEEESNPPPFPGTTEKGKGKGKEKKEKQPEPERRKVVMSKPFDMFSCCCFLDSLTLPVYSVSDPNPMPLEAELQLPCVCGMSLRRLIEKQANSLLIDGDTPLQVEYVAPPKPDGFLPSPSPSTERPPILWEDPDDIPPSTPTEEYERGRSTSRRVSPSQSRNPSQTREPSVGRFFRVGSSSDRLFAMGGWRHGSSSSGSRDHNGHGSGHGSDSSRGRRGEVVQHANLTSAVAAAVGGSSGVGGESRASSRTASRAASRAPSRSASRQGR